MVAAEHGGREQPAASGLDRQEIEELTSMMRSEAAFGAVRRGLAERGLTHADSLLVGLVEDEEGGAAGAVVAPGPRVLVFDSPAPTGLDDIAPDDWREATADECAELFPLVRHGLRLL